MTIQANSSWSDYQPSKTILVWACLVTAAATMVIGFTWGGWMTGSASQAQARTAGEVARGELASAICIERFSAAPDAAAQLTALKALPDGFKKREFIDAGGWSVMPGQKTPDRRGSEGCVAGLTA